MWFWKKSNKILEQQRLDVDQVHLLHYLKQKRQSFKRKKVANS